MFSISDAKNESGEWIMSPEQIRAEMNAGYQEIMDIDDWYSEQYDYNDGPDINPELCNHEDTSGKCGNCEIPGCNCDWSFYVPTHCDICEKEF